jgi:signal peptidase II
MSKFFSYRFLIAVIVILSLIFIDQFSKFFLIDFLKTQPGYLLYLNPFMDIVYTWNYGISFGFFSQYHKYSNLLFFVSNSLIILYLIGSYVFDSKISKIYLLIISGGLGNLIDRVIHGAVFDFICVHWQDYYFPIFNIADIFISVGIFFFVLETFLMRKTVKSLQVSR